MIPTEERLKKKKKQAKNSTRLRAIYRVHPVKDSTCENFHSNLSVSSSRSQSLTTLLYPRVGWRVSGTWFPMLPGVGLGLSGLGVGWNGRAMERSPLAMCRARMKPQRGLGEALRATASLAPHGLPDGGGAEHTHCPEGGVEASGEFSPSCGRAMGIVWIGILALLAL